ncbi:IS4 family transposase, partial [Actinocrinis puniceicyclus]
LAEPLALLGGLDTDYQTPTSGGIAKARARLGEAPVREVFEQVAVPVAEPDTPGAFMAGRWRVLAADGTVFDVPDSEENRAAFATPSGGAFPQVRAVLLTECGSRATLDARLAPCSGKGTGERTALRAMAGTVQALAEDQDVLLTCDQGLYSFKLWCRYQDTGAGLLWRMADGVEIAHVADLPDGSYTALVFDKGAERNRRDALIAAARAGGDLPREGCRPVRVVEYYVEERGPAPHQRELFCLITNLLDPGEATAAELGAAYHLRWTGSEGANNEIKNGLRGPGGVLRSHSPQLVRAEIYGYLLAHYAICALICAAVTEHNLDPGRVKFTKAVRLVRARVADPRAFSP